MDSQVRTGLLHAGSATAGAIAAVGFLSQHSVDLYAAWNQLNTIVAEVMKLVAMISPLATMAYGIYKSSTAQKLADVVKDPKAPDIAAALPVTPQTEAVADALKKG